MKFVNGIFGTLFLIIGFVGMLYQFVRCLPGANAYNNGAGEIHAFFLLFFVLVFVGGALFVVSAEKL